MYPSGQCPLSRAMPTLECPPELVSERPEMADYCPMRSGASDQRDTMDMNALYAFRGAFPMDIQGPTLFHVESSSSSYVHSIAFRGTARIQAAARRTSVSEPSPL